MDAKVFEMNNNDVIQYLKGLVMTQEITEHTIRRNLVINMCIQALEKVPALEAENARLREKETPKKPKYINNGCNCQCCDRRLPDAILQCCPYCGQRIDWTSDKE